MFRLINKWFLLIILINVSIFTLARNPTKYNVVVIAQREYIDNQALMDLSNALNALPFDDKIAIDSIIIFRTDLNKFVAFPQNEHLFINYDNNIFSQKANELTCYENFQSWINCNGTKRPTNKVIDMCFMLNSSKNCTQKVIANIGLDINICNNLNEFKTEITNQKINKILKKSKNSKKTIYVYHYINDEPIKNVIAYKNTCDSIADNLPIEWKSYRPEFTIEITNQDVFEAINIEQDFWYCFKWVHHPEFFNYILYLNNLKIDINIKGNSNVYFCTQKDGVVTCYINESELVNLCEKNYKKSNGVGCIYEQLWQIKLQTSVGHNCPDIIGNESIVLKNKSLQCPN